MILGTYNISITGTNHVSSETVNITTIVNKGPCTKPLVQVAQQNPCLSDELCKDAEKVSACCWDFISCKFINISLTESTMLAKHLHH